MFALEKSTKFSRKKSTYLARRAWSLVRLALLWARKGGLLRNKHRLAIALAKLTRKLTGSRREARGALAYGDREISFDETPVFHIRMRRRSPPRFRLAQLPCIRPEVVDFDWDEDSICVGDEMCGYRYGDDDVEEEEWEEELQELEGRERDCEEGIDSKAERFIADFYEEIKLERQKSCLRRKNAIKDRD